MSHDSFVITPPRILVVCSQAKRRERIATAARNAGHFVEAVATGERAIDRFIIDPCNAILCDFQLTGRDGLSTLRAIRWAPGGNVVRVGLFYEDERFAHVAQEHAAEIDAELAIVGEIDDAELTSMLELWHPHHSAPPEKKQVALADSSTAVRGRRRREMSSEEVTFEGRALIEGQEAHSEAQLIAEGSFQDSFFVSLFVYLHEQGLSGSLVLAEPQTSKPRLQESPRLIFVNGLPALALREAVDIAEGPYGLRDEPGAVRRKALEEMVCELFAQTAARYEVWSHRVPRCLSSPFSFSAWLRKGIFEAMSQAQLDKQLAFQDGHSYRCDFANDLALMAFANDRHISSLIGEVRGQQKEIDHRFVEFRDDQGERLRVLVLLQALGKLERSRHNLSRHRPIAENPLGALREESSSISPRVMHSESAASLMGSTHSGSPTFYDDAEWQHRLSELASPEQLEEQGAERELIGVPTNPGIRPENIEQARLMFERGRGIFAAGLVDEALVDLRFAARFLGNDPYVQAFRAWVEFVRLDRLSAEQPESAAQVQSEASSWMNRLRSLAEGVEDAGIFLLEARALLRTGQAELAERTYEKVLDLDPSSTEARAALRQLSSRRDKTE